MDTTDPFAGPRTNLRELVKWLATTFAALAAAVVAGSPFSGLGSLKLNDWRFYVAVIALVSSAGFLMWALRRMIFLQRPDVVYPTQLRSSYQVGAIKDPVERQEIAAVIADIHEHRADLLPKNVETFDALEKAIAESWSIANDSSATEGERKVALERYNAYRGTADVVLFYATFSRLHRRIFSAISRVQLLALGALLFLVVFAWAAAPAKKDEVGKGAVTAQACSCCQREKM